MARVTIEDCIPYVRNRFELVLVAVQRSKELNYGAPSLLSDVKIKKEKDAVVALREIATGKLNIENMRNLIKKALATKGGNIGVKSEDINKVEQKAMEGIKLLEDGISHLPKKEQIYQDEEVIEEEDVDL